MKRSPMVRKTPLVAKAPFRNKAPMPRRDCSFRRTPIKPVSDKRRADNRVRRVVVDAMYEARPWCPRCGQPTAAMAGHERLARAHGGSILAPEALLCHACNGWAEDEPIIAAWTGWKVSSKHPHDPALGIGEAWDLRGERVIFELLQEAS